MTGCSGIVWPMTLPCLGHWLMMTYTIGMCVVPPCKICASIVGLLVTLPMHVCCALAALVTCCPFEPPSVQLAPVFLEYPLGFGLHPHRELDMVETRSHVTHQEFVTTLTTMESVPTETVVSCTSAAFVLAPILPQSARNNFNIDFSPLPSGIISPVNVNLLQHVLSTHPHRRLVDYVLNSFRFGFTLALLATSLVLVHVTYYRLVRTPHLFSQLFARNFLKVKLLVLFVVLLFIRFTVHLYREKMVHFISS